MNYDDFLLRIAVGSDASLGKVKNKTATWSVLRRKCATPTRGHETMKDYLALPKAEQDRLKNVGFFLGGECANNRRKSNNISERSLIVLDLDAVTPEILDDLDGGFTALSGYEFFVYSTRKHTAAAPRLRVVILLQEPIPADRFAPLSRILASKIDPTVDAIDDVSFRLAQLMYWPSVCSDGAFYFHHNAGAAVDAEAVLNDFGDWRDWTKLPFSVNQGRRRPTDPSVKAEDPRTKRGLVGAFCRAYSIEDAMTVFLPGVYVEGDDASTKPRYTFVGGSTSNGAIVEDDGLFLYSYHTTDPCSERLVNAFDLVRIHKYGELDKDCDDRRATEYPSYERMKGLLDSDPNVARELRAEQYDVMAMFEDIADVDEPGLGEDIEDAPTGADELETQAKADSSWMDQLEVTPQGGIKPTVTNIAIILEHDPRIRGSIAFNEFTSEIVARRAVRSKMSIMPRLPIRDAINGDIWSDRHDNCLRLILEAAAGDGKPGYGLRVTDRDLAGGVMTAAEKNRFHPVRDYLNSLKWDGRTRIASMFTHYLGAPNTSYVRESARLMLLGAVTRVFEPGHKFDFVVILEGVQGKRKSTFVSVLANHWFCELEGHFADRKRLVEAMQGAWLLELPELSIFNNSEIQELKAFVSATFDRARMAYARRAQDFHRQCVFIGSTNEAEYLRDSTGNRRFWPIPCLVSEIDTDELRRNRDQLWAEAVHTYRAMREKHPVGALPLYMVEHDARQQALEMQESRRVDTAAEGMAGQIDDWLNRPIDPTILNAKRDPFTNLDAHPNSGIRNSVCLLEIWVECFGGDSERYTQATAQMLGRAMRHLEEWEPIGREVHRDYGRQRIYQRKPAVAADVFDDDLFS